MLSGLFGLVSLASDPFNCVESNGFVEGCIFQIEATDTEWMGIPAGELPENLSEEQIIALVALVAVALWFLSAMLLSPFILAGMAYWILFRNEPVMLKVRVKVHNNSLLVKAKRWWAVSPV